MVISWLLAGYKIVSHFEDFNVDYGMAVRIFSIMAIDRESKVVISITLTLTLTAYGVFGRVYFCTIYICRIHYSEPKVRHIVYSASVIDWVPGPGQN